MKLSVLAGNILATLFPYSVFNVFQAIKVRYILAKNEIYFKGNCKKFGNDCRIYEPSRTGGLHNISIGDRFTMGEMSILETITSYCDVTYKPEIKIGNNVSLGKRCHVGAINKIFIGDNVLTGADVLITDHSHGQSIIANIKKPPKERELYSKGGINIENNVWIGDKVTILPGVTIGCNTIIGANSVISHSIPKNVVACGNPAKVVKIINE